MWKGDNKNRGLRIFANQQVKLESINWSDQYEDHYVKQFIPCLINNDFQLLGIWTSQNNSPNFRYIGQLWKYLQINKSYFDKIMIAGDFNSNAIWDEWDRWWNHSDVVKELKELDIESLYHKTHNENQGKESNPTFFLHSKLEKPYHIDYFFVSKSIFDILTNFEIADKAIWLKYSDHLPVICEF